MLLFKSFYGVMILFLLASSIFVWIFYSKYKKKEYYYDLTTLLVEQTEDGIPLSIPTKTYDSYVVDLHALKFDPVTNQKKIYLTGQ